MVPGGPYDVTQDTSLSPRAANWNITIDKQNKTGSSQHVTSDNGVSQGQMGTARKLIGFHSPQLKQIPCSYGINQKVKVQSHNKNRFVTASLRKQTTHWVKSIYGCCSVSQRVSDLSLSLSLSLCLEVECCESSSSRSLCDLKYTPLLCPEMLLFPFEIVLTIAPLPPLRHWPRAFANTVLQYADSSVCGRLRIQFWGNFIFSISVQLSKNAFIMACAKNGVNLSKLILLAISETACELGLSECYELWGFTGGSKFQDCLIN